MKKIFIEGKIKSGKSYIIKTLLERLNLKYGGFITYPYFENNLRVGFKIKDLLTNEEEFVAKFNIDGNLIVFPKVFDDIGVKSLNNAYHNCEIIVMDELGFLEEESNLFKDKIIEILKGEKIVFAAIKERKTPFLEKIIKFGKVFIVNRDNRECILEMILKEVLDGSL